ncbi:MAG: hypothetical protein GWN00_19960 [Aliifodinibius sp.]|nr:hypothetical protein [Fodinibius sp.]NIY26997.1 hypothetical protein [Fodinibius sp.]
MATMYIREYKYLTRDEGGNVIQAGQEDGFAAGQSVTFTTSAQSAAFQDTTRFVRISCDAEAFLDFGSNPTAATTDGINVQADTPEFFGVQPGQKVAAYDGTS